MNTALPPNSSVFAIVPDAHGVWLATDVGLWYGRGKAWQLLAVVSAQQAITAIARPNSNEHHAPLLVGGVPGGIQLSVDNGAHWFTSAVDDVTSGVTCFAVSPRFAHDRVMLAGTANDGVLRSTDGGRHWNVSNFGLIDFTVLALAVSPNWNNREEAFLATEDGVYRSPNGGRAWKRADNGIEIVIVQTLAVSPHFASDRTLYAGNAIETIYRSTDAARSWQPLDGSPRDAMCIWIDPIEPAALVVGTSDGLIARSCDGGASWARAAAYPDAVLALAAHDGVLYAGLYEGGLLVSHDGGASWRREEVSDEEPRRHQTRR